MKRREKRGGKREEGGERVDGEWTLWPFQFSSQTDSYSTLQSGSISTQDHRT